MENKTVRGEKASSYGLYKNKYNEIDYIEFMRISALHWKDIIEEGRTDIDYYKEMAEIDIKCHDHFMSKGRWK